MRRQHNVILNVEKNNVNISFFVLKTTNVYWYLQTYIIHIMIVSDFFRYSSNNYNNTI